MSAGKTVYGGIQQAKATKELQKLSRPDLTVPEEAKQSLNISRMLASDRNRGYNDIATELAAATGNAMGMVNRQGGSLADRLAAVASITADQNTQLRNARYQADQQYLTDLEGLKGSLSEMATEKKRIQADQQAKYAAQVASLQGLAGAGTENILGGVSDMVGVAGQQLNYNQQMKMLDQQNAMELEKLRGGNPLRQETFTPKSMTINNPSLNSSNVNLSASLNPTNPIANQYPMLKGAGIMKPATGIGAGIGKSMNFSNPNNAISQQQTVTPQQMQQMIEEMLQIQMMTK
jgi:F0F1-type ATP synthase membrane subunit c/vacuolar-type H+-ATPase subunit K